MPTPAFKTLDVLDGAGATKKARVYDLAGDGSTGYLPSTATEDGLDVAQGATTDAAATTDTGTFSLIALFKRLLGKFQAGQKAMSASLPVVIASDQSAIPVSAASLPLPAGAATEATLSALKTAVQAQVALSTSLWTDNSGAYYVRRDTVNESTGVISVAFTDPTGTTATPGAGLRPLSTVTKEVIEALFDVLTTGTGYTAGDLLARVAIYNAETASATFVWFNLTAGTILGSPPNAAHVEKSEENIGARQVGTWTVAAASLPLPTGAAQDGTDITTPTAMPTGGAGIRGWLSAIWTKLNGSLAVTGTFWQATQPVSLAATTSGGSTPYSFLAAGGGNQDSTVIKGTPGQVYGWQLLNTSAAVRYVKVYDKATGPTSADTPVKRFSIPAGGGLVIPQPAGVAFASGISFRCCTGVADSDATAVTANDVIVNCNYR